MNLDLKTISQLKFAKIILRNIYNIVFLILILLIFWLLFFLYQNLYEVVIVPKPIESTTLQAKQPKINIEKFNSVTEKLELKKDASLEDLSGIRNPFVTY